jgi:hypothetical protein
MGLWRGVIPYVTYISNYVVLSCDNDDVNPPNSFLFLGLDFCRCFPSILHTQAVDYPITGYFICVDFTAYGDFPYAP